MHRFIFSLVFLFFFLALQSAQAHESQPGTVEIEEIGNDRFKVVWRAPIYYNKPHPARLELPDHWQTVGQPTERRRASDIVFERVITAGQQGLNGSIIRFPGLEATITDVYVRVKRLDGSQATNVVRPTKPWTELRGERSWHETSREYLFLGFHHILLGIDHLLVVDDQEKLVGLLSDRDLRQYWASPATTLSTTKLMDPLLAEMQPEFKDWRIDDYMREEAKKAQLAELHRAVVVVEQHLETCRVLALVRTVGVGRVVADGEQQCLDAALLRQDRPLHR